MSARSSAAAWLICLLGWASAAFGATSGPTVTVTGGKVQGVRLGAVVAYKGIPFAAPPVGALRWKNPRAVQSWHGVRKAATFGPACTQSKPPFQLPSSEDCLYLNIWTGARSAQEHRPVMVWIHGGGFTNGAAGEPPYDGLRFAQQGIVLVSIAYRLGPFGFLVHEQLDREGAHPSGNYGLRDMIAALQWIRCNVARFGGDPDQVTIAGESSGGAAVSLLAVMPAAHGLFRATISQSGDASFRAPRYSLYTPDDSGPVQTRRHAESVGRAVLQELGTESLAAARALPAEVVLKAVQGRGDLWTGPAIDGELLPDTNVARYREGRFNDTPILLGTNSDEGGRRAPAAATKALLLADVDRSTCPGELRAVLATYPLEDDADARRAFELVVRDDAFAWNSWTWARWQVRRGHGAAYLYYFDFRLPKFPDGSGHWMEVPYVFGNFGWFDEQHMVLRAEDLALSRLIRAYWINFVTTGNPNGTQLSPWPSFNEKTSSAFVFDATPGARQLPNLDRLEAIDAWHSCAWGHRGF